MILFLVAVTISSKIQRKYLFQVIIGVLVLSSIIMSYQVYRQQPSEPVRSDVGINTIPVGEFPLGVAIDPDTQKVYVANSGSKTVSVIDEKNINVLKGLFLLKFH